MKDKAGEWVQQAEGKMRRADGMVTGLEWEYSEGLPSQTAGAHVRISKTESCGHLRHILRGWAHRGQTQPPRGPPVAMLEAEVVGSVGEAVTFEASS